MPVALWVAWLLARREFAGKAWVSALVHLPLVLPPVVTGYLLLLTFGRNGALGGFLESIGIVLAFRGDIAAIYTNDPELIARAATLFAISALVFIPDSLQVVMGQAIRALGDAWVAIAAYIASFVILMIPLGWYMITERGWDERGLALAITIACALATALLCWRFRILTKVRR